MSTASDDQIWLWLTIVHDVHVYKLYLLTYFFGLYSNQNEQQTLSEFTDKAHVYIRRRSRCQSHWMRCHSAPCSRSTGAHWYVMAMGSFIRIHSSYSLGPGAPIYQLARRWEPELPELLDWWPA